MVIGVLTLHLYLLACASLKEKRGRLKPLINRLRRTFNVSVAEVGEQDTWQNAVLACAVVSTDTGQVHSALQKVVAWVEINFRDVEVTNDFVEIIQ